MAPKSSKTSANKNSRRPLAVSSPKQRQGRYFEQQALLFLQAQGLVLIAQNWQQPKTGELDLIMVEAGQAWPTLVFIEVRQRLRSSFGDAALSVTSAKQRKITKTAKYFLQYHPQYANYECRFDVIAYDIRYPPIKDDQHDSVDHKNLDASYQPEWLAAAFVASAW